MRQTLKNYYSLLRPHQWIKNFFIFAPLFFTFNFSIEKIFIVSYGFIAFCFAASSIYIFNDYHDIAEDREHPQKKDRPLACGKISKKSAIFLMIFFLAVAITSGMLLSVEYTLILIFYIILNLLYTIRLKHIAILDITIISIGFVLRIFAGTVLIKTNTSMWIILVTFMLALFLALSKRRDDCLLFADGKKTRKNIDGYNLEMINNAMVLMAGVTVVAYIMYTVSPEVIERIGSDKLYLTTIFVIMGIFRYMQITFVKNDSSSPTKILLRDRFLQLTISGWLASFYIIHLFKEI